MASVQVDIDIDEFRLCELGPYTTETEYTPREDLEHVKNSLTEEKEEQLTSILDRLDAVEDAVGSAREPCEALHNGDGNQEHIQLFVNRYKATGNAFESMNKPFQQFLSARYDLELLDRLGDDLVNDIVDKGQTVLEQGEPVKIGLYLDPDEFPDEFASTPPPDMDMSDYTVKAIVAPPTQYKAEVNRLKEAYTQILRDAVMQQPAEPGTDIDHDANPEPSHDPMFR